MEAQFLFSLLGGGSNPCTPVIHTTVVDCVISFHYTSIE